MAYSKRFPRHIKGTLAPIWEEIALTDEEEKEVEEGVKHINIQLMEECIKESIVIMSHAGLKEYQSDIISIANSLFEKRASHLVFWKEKRCKEKFDEKFLKNE
jgi:hypothetical protein